MASGVTVIGNFSGPMIGGIIAALVGIKSIFPVTAALMLLGVWQYSSMEEWKKED